jgi:hypothetical protein
VGARAAGVRSVPVPGDWVVTFMPADPVSTRARSVKSRWRSRSVPRAPDGRAEAGADATGGACDADRSRDRARVRAARRPEELWASSGRTGAARARPAPANTSPWVHWSGWHAQWSEVVPAAARSTTWMSCVRPAGPSPDPLHGRAPDPWGGHGQFTDPYAPRPSSAGP